MAYSTFNVDEISGTVMSRTNLKKLAPLAVVLLFGAFVACAALATPVNEACLFLCDSGIVFESRPFGILGSRDQSPPKLGRFDHSRR